MESQIQELDEKIHNFANQRNELETAVAELRLKLDASYKLHDHLLQLQPRWETMASQMDEYLESYTAASILKAACSIYLGYFTRKSRERLISTWCNSLFALGLPQLPQAWSLSNCDSETPNEKLLARWFLSCSQMVSTFALMFPSRDVYSSVPWLQHYYCDEFVFESTMISQSTLKIPLLIDSQVIVC